MYSAPGQIDGSTISFDAPLEDLHQWAINNGYLDSEQYTKRFTRDELLNILPITGPNGEAVFPYTGGAASAQFQPIINSGYSSNGRTYLSPNQWEQMQSAGGKASINPLLAWAAPLAFGVGAAGGFGAGAAGGLSSGLTEGGALASEAGFVPGSFELGASGYGGSAAAGLDAAGAEWLAGSGMGLPQLPGTPSGGGSSGGTSPFNPSQIGSAVGSALGIMGGGQGTGGSTGGSGTNPLAGLAGIGSGLYDLFGGGAQIDPSKLNYLWQAGVDTYNTARDPQQALYNRTQQQLQDQTRAAQSARGTAMSPFGAAGEADVMKNFNIDWQNNLLQRQLGGLGGLATATGGYFDQANKNRTFRQDQLQSGTNAVLTGVNQGMAPGGWLNSLWNQYGGGTPTAAGQTPSMATPNYWGSATPTPDAFSNQQFNMFDPSTYYGGGGAANTNYYGMAA